jgi:antirestriction protein ArdC
MKNGFGSEGYAMEELVAELASAFQCALLDISPSPREDHAKYLNNWLKVEG